MGDTKYLLLDVETVVDSDLLATQLYPELVGKGFAAAGRYREEHGPWVPWVYHLPVSICVGEVDSDLALSDVYLVGSRSGDPSSDLLSSLLSRREELGFPQLITYGGDCFDIPVLTMTALRGGLRFPDPFTLDHRDLRELLSERLTVPHGGLDLLSMAVGMPGKLGTSGEDVEALWDAGDGLAIDGYCVTDVFRTYFLFLRLKMLEQAVDERALRFGALEVLQGFSGGRLARQTDEYYQEVQRVVAAEAVLGRADA